MLDSQCPSCGAPIQIKNQASLYAVCSYCGTKSLREADKLKEVGKVAALINDGTPLKIGTRGRFEGKPFEIIGRIQLQFAYGFWNEWHLDSGGRSCWLGEATGNYVFTTLTDTAGMNIPPFKQVEVGQMIELDGEQFFATDILDGKCVSGEGELPFDFNGGYKAPVIDLVSRKENFATLDYSEEKPLLFLGEYAEFKELNLTDMRELEGWQKPA